MNKKTKILLLGISSLSVATIVSTSIIVPLNVQKNETIEIIDFVPYPKAEKDLNTNDVIKNQYSSPELNNNQEKDLSSSEETYPNYNQKIEVVNKSKKTEDELKSDKNHDLKNNNEQEKEEISSNEALIYDQLIEEWEEFEDSTNKNSTNFYYSPSQLKLKDIISEVKLKDINNKFITLNNSSVNQYKDFIANSNIILDDILSICNGKLDNLLYSNIDSIYWDKISSGYNEIRELLFIELSKAYEAQKNNNDQKETLEAHIDSLSLKLSGHGIESIILAPEKIEREITGYQNQNDGLIDNNLLTANNQYELIWPLIAKFLSNLSEQKFYIQSDKNKLDKEDLSKVMFENLINSASPLIFDFFIKNKKESNISEEINIKARSIDENKEIVDQTKASSVDISQYITFIYKLFNGKATYLDIQEIIPADLVKGIPQSFYGIAFNALQTLIGNPFKDEGLDLYDINFSLIQRIFSTIDLVNSIVDIRSMLSKNGYVNITYFDNWMKEQEQKIKDSKDSKFLLSKKVLPIVDKLNKLLSYRLELANYNEEAQKQALNVFFDTTFKTLSEFDLLEYKKDDTIRPIPGLEVTQSYIDKVDDVNIRNVLNDTFIFIKNLDKGIYESDFSNNILSVKYNDEDQFVDEVERAKTCNNVFDSSYFGCLYNLYSKLEKLNIHNDELSNNNIKFAKANLKAFAMSKINILDSSYTLTYDDIWDSEGNKKPFIQNLANKKNNLISNLFLTIYGQNSEYYNSYITMIEGIKILPGTNYRSVVPLASAAFLSFDNTIPLDGFKIQDLVESYKPVAGIVVDLIKGLMEKDPMLGPLLNGILDMIVGKIEPEALIGILSSVIPSVPNIPEAIVSLVTGDFKNWRNSQYGYLNRFKNVFREVAKLLTFRVWGTHTYIYKAEQAFESSGINGYLNINATYVRDEIPGKFNWFNSTLPSIDYRSTKYDPFSMLDNYVINRIVNTTSISREDATKVLEDILYQAIGVGLDKKIAGYTPQAFSE